MRWIAYFILAYLAMGLQIGLAPYVSWRGAAPNFGLLAMIFVAANAPREPALLGCFAMGLFQDLLTAQQPGLFAFSYGMVGLVATGPQQKLVRHSITAQTAFTLFGGVITAVAILAQGWIHPPGAAIAAEVGGAPRLPAISVSAGVLFLGVIYTTLLAPPVLAGLQRSRKLFSFAPPRRRGWIG